jgi:hypothetical protein
MGEKLDLYVEEDELEISGNLLNCPIDHRYVCQVWGNEEIRGACGICKSELVTCTTWVGGYCCSIPIDRTNNRNG